MADKYDFPKTREQLNQLVADSVNSKQISNKPIGICAAKTSLDCTR